MIRATLDTTVAYLRMWWWRARWRRQHPDLSEPPTPEWRALRLDLYSPDWAWRWRQIDRQQRADPERESF